MSRINNIIHDRDRGVEVLLFKKNREVIKNPDILYKINLRKIISVFNKEFDFQINFQVKRKN